MTPLFFGSSTEPLFGIYTPPLESPGRNRGVLLCNPFGDEALKAHRAYRQLADLLARERFHVLRFDYFGTGDSWGEAYDATVERWVSDVGVALDELKDSSGVAKLSVVGLRFGAGLALAGASGRRDIDRVVLWDPVISGVDYLRSLRRAHTAYLKAELGGAWQPRPAAETTSEVMGFPITEALRAGISSTNLETAEVSRLRKGTLVVSKTSPRHAALCEGLERQQLKLDRKLVPSTIAWNSDDALNAAPALATLRSIAEALS